jgi:hypothetical protein
MKDFHKFSLAKGINSRRGQMRSSLNLKLSCLLGMWSVICVVGAICEREELVEFVFICVVHEHNDVCKQMEHERRLGVERMN